jgi:hypothetical protein
MASFMWFFYLDGVLGLWLTGLSNGMAFNTLNQLELSQFLARACMLVFCFILTLGLEFSLDESYLFCIQSTKTAVIWTVATKNPMQMHTSELFLANRTHLMTPREGLAFFWFFWISYVRFRDRFPRNRHEIVQNWKDTSVGRHNETKANICIPSGLLFIWGVVPSF